MSEFKEGDKVVLKNGFSDYWTDDYEGIRNVFYRSGVGLVCTRNNKDSTGYYVRATPNHFTKVGVFLGGE